MRFKPGTKISKDLENGGVAWCPKEIWYGICVVECVFSMDPSNLLGYERFGFNASVPYGELSADESGVDTSTTANASGTAQRPYSHRRRLQVERVLKVSNHSNSGVAVSGNEHKFSKAKPGYHDR